MELEIDSLSIADLESRYSINRGNVYKRIETLKEKGYSLEFEQRGRKTYANADQVALLDSLHSYIQVNKEMKSFPALGGEVSHSLVRQSEMSHETQDSRSAITKTSPQMIALSPEQLIELATAIAPLPPAAPPDPFENLEQLKRACESGWYLSSSQLKPLLNRVSLPSKEFYAFGYTFTPSGKNGAEKAWKITKRWELRE